MKILLTGATGYIGQRILPVLIEKGSHTVFCCTRDKQRFHVEEEYREFIEVIEVDFLQEDVSEKIPSDIDAAYYLMHSMSSSRNYDELELKVARNFNKAMESTSVNQVIYLSGMINEDELSKHLLSRKAVEQELEKGRFHLTVLRAGIVIGSGSASFEIIRDLVEKLPVMIAPRWLNTRCQPIGIRDVLQMLEGVLGLEETYDTNYDIAGPDILSYKEMLLQYAEVRGMNRYIYIVPVMTPRLSSYWLYFVTSTSYKLATSLVDSMKVEVVARDNEINHILNINPAGYKLSLKRAFDKIDQNQIVSSWKDSIVSGRFNTKISKFIQVPEHGCYKDGRERKIKNPEAVLDKIWSIGGDRGWYYGTWLWKIRGYLDKMSGGVGLKRGRTHKSKIEAGDAVDFWRVLYANKKEGRLLLFAEMKVPGDAWLEFNVEDDMLYQTATFRPKGLWGRIYWYLVYPFHGFIFGGMIRKIAKSKEAD